MAITKEELLNASSEDYMNDNQLEFFREFLEQQKQETIAHIQNAQAQLNERPEMNDDADRAQYEEESRIALRIVDRESKLLPKFDTALARIRNGEYGYCLESGEEIGIKRLLLRPTAEYCADIKAVRESNERLFRE
ncbi:RNA polymerase-binding protein DksA [Neptuniibacter sp. QD34_54]|uniref:RNA polymerase-binding protein DksA n=1 Tax=Neptuniibacter sp. QD34_54 TaxID=3398208 RepID=UPI0039F5FF10